MISQNNIKEYSIRDYREEDFAGIMKLWIETGLGDPARGDDEKIIAKSIELGGKFLVMEEKKTGIICGTSWMTFDGRRINLHHFGILPEYQGKGLSSLLLNKSLEFVKKKGCQVKIEVHRKNLKAIDLYKKCGFEYLGDYNVFIIRDLNRIKKL
jgi:ribosomal-protein-alanine N-acetyltransferase